LLNLKRILALLILVSVGVLSVVVWKHLAQKTALEVFEDLPKNVDVELTKLHYTHNEDGRQRWVLDAEQADYRRHQGLIDLQDIHLTFNDSGPFSQLQLTAGAGSFAENEQLVKLWDQVLVQTSRADQLTVATLDYAAGQRRFVSPDAVHYVSDRMDVTGVGLEIHVDKGYLILKTNVHAKIFANEKSE